MEYINLTEAAKAIGVSRTAVKKHLITAKRVSYLKFRDKKLCHPR
jgi:predicted ArsR family transcriptional regulator